MVQGAEREAAVPSFPPCPPPPAPASSGLPQQGLPEAPANLLSLLNQEAFTHRPSAQPPRQEGWGSKAQTPLRGAREGRA